MCLLSLTDDGVESSVFEGLRKAVIDSYGFEQLFVLDALEHAGLFKKQERSRYAIASTSFVASTTFAQLRSSLNLIVDNPYGNPGMTEPTDIAYVTSRYAPLSIRLVEHALAEKGWATQACADALKLVPGPTVDFSRGAASAAAAAADAHAADDEDGVGGGTRRKVMLVFFLGGVTFMEIAALRLLSRKGDWDIIVGTTKLVNGNTMLQGILDDVQTKLH